MGEHSLLLQKIFSMRKMKEDDMATFISRFEVKVYPLKIFGVVFDDDMIMAKIIRTLPEEFRYFVNAWESTEKTARTRENLSNRLILEEGRMKASEMNSDEFGEAFVSRYGKDRKCFVTKGNYKCFNCGQMGHVKKNCRVNRQRSQGCFICSINY